MYKISVDVADAFKGNYDFTSSNTRVVVVGGKVKMYLFDNCIAIKVLSTGEVTYSNCGFHTKTTKDRLMALGVRTYIKNNIMYDSNDKPFNNKIID